VKKEGKEGEGKKKFLDFIFFTKRQAVFFGRGVV